MAYIHSLISWKKYAVISRLGVFVVSEKKDLYTIGYAQFSLDSFVRVLKQFGVTAVADVRSVPFSSFHSEYNSTNLKRFLKYSGIEYVFLGEHLGARFPDKSVYVNGVARYDKIAKHELFLRGIKRLIDGSMNYTIALMCAEKDPLNCHRAMLVARNATNFFNIKHILGVGKVEIHRDTEFRLLKMYNLEQLKLPGLSGESAALDEAYRRRSEQIAYNDGTESNDNEDMDCA